MSKLDPFSPAAKLRQAALAAKKARGEEIKWTDIIGLLEPNPDLPDCPSRDPATNEPCALPNHHDGPHQAVITW